MQVVIRGRRPSDRGMTHYQTETRNISAMFAIEGSVRERLPAGQSSAAADGESRFNPLWDPQ